MPLGAQQTIQFDFQNAASGIRSGTNLGTFNTVNAGSTAGFESVLDGIKFTYSAGGGLGSTIDFFGTFNSINIQGTDELAFSNSSLTFSDITLQIVAASNTAGETQRIEFLNATGGVVGSLNDTQVVDGAVSFSGQFSSIRFTSSHNFSVESITTTINCFCAGTRFATPDGEVAVEKLKAGDIVLTADGKISTVEWLGRQEVDVRVSDPRKVNPICISKGALGENLPQRDLWVSQDHAVGIDGYLVNAGALANGTTIYQVARMPLDGFTYYHIETDAHELLLAEGCPAESFVDYAALDSFENAGERDAARVPEMPLPRISAARMVPDAITQKIAARAPRLDMVKTTRRDAA